MNKIKYLLLSLLLSNIFIISIFAEDLNLVFVLGENDKYYWYENNEIQGTYLDPRCVMGDETCRGREIYDPVSDGWYWLDSVYGGAKAQSKEVWIPYIFQDEEPGSTEGKWVRYDENGKMIKGWYTVSSDLDKELYPEQIDNTYYYDLITGEMYKGTRIIEDNIYHFDEVSGVLYKGFYYEGENIYYHDEIDGKRIFGFRDINNGFYYFNIDNGIMHKGFFDYEGNTYYFDEEGKRAHGFKEINGNTYYFDLNTGVMLKGRHNIDGKNYIFENDGKLRKITYWTPRYYSQKDGRWSDRYFYTRWPMRSSGCVPTSLAMVIEPMIGREVLPTEVAQYLVDNGLYNNGTIGAGGRAISSAASHYGFNYDVLYDAWQVKDALANGKMVIAMVGPGEFIPSGYTHAMVLFGGYDTTTVYDPLGNNKDNYNVDYLWSQRSFDGNDNALGSPFIAVYR